MKTKLAFAVLFAAFGAMAFAESMTPEQTGALKAAQQFVDSFNKGDSKAVIATCAEQTSIIDEFPPHEWHGSGSCSKWIADYDADAKKNSISDGGVKLGDPLHVDVTGDSAYLVFPANYTYKQKGKNVSEVGSILTLALKHEGDAWRITGWSWAKH